MLKMVLRGLGLAWCSSLVVLAACAAQEPHSVGGMTASDVFSDRGVRAVANAACLGDIDRIRRLADRDVNVDQPGLDGVTPLIWALTCESHSGMRALLELGADPNHRVNRRSGRSAVLFASASRDSSLLALLLDYGGDPDAGDLDGNDVPLTLAISMGIMRDDWTHYEVLLAAGADIHQQYVPRLPNRTPLKALAAFNRFCRIAPHLAGAQAGVRFDILYGARTARLSDDFEGKPCQAEVIAIAEAGLSPEEWALYRQFAEQQGFEIQQP